MKVNPRRLFGLLLFLTRIDLSVLITATRYMVNYYNNHQPVFVNDSLILELTTSVTLTDQPAARTMHCDVNVVTSSSRKLLIHFLSLEISFDVNHPDRLHIFDYRPNGEAVRITPPQGLYGLFDTYYYTGRARGVEDFTSSVNRLKLDYTGRPSLAYDGFKVLITSFKDGNGNCEKGFVRCHRKKICIPVSTWCDGFRNCGNDDNSDETDCEVVMTTGLDSFGSTTVVLVAAIACSIFLITIAVALYIVYRLNKRDAIKTNVIVYARRKATKRQLSDKNGDLSRLYAPPSYEVVIGMGEDPPPYQAVANIYSSPSDEDEMDEQMAYDVGATAATPTDTHDVIETAQLGRHGSVCVTSALVTKDIDGNDCPAECSSASGSLPNGHAQSKNNVKRTDIQGRIAVPEIEVLSCEENDSDNSKDENYNKSKSPKETIARVSFRRSPSNREAADIEFLDSEDCIS